MSPLPSDCVEFLESGQQLSYSADGSSIGRIRLKQASELRPRFARLYPGRTVIEDPRAHLDGVYEIELIDLVGESEYYGPQGLLCWIPSIERFGSVDEEHSTVLCYTKATWADIVRNPVGHLDEQWSLGSVHADWLLPWLWFPFRIRSGRAVLAPYEAACPRHQEAIVGGQKPVSKLLRAYRRRNPDLWLEQCLGVFPCSGVPLSKCEWKFCDTCRVAEQDWLNSQINEIPALPATANSQGWIRCPGCGIRFSTSDDAVFQDGFHLTCGQRILPMM